MPPKVVCVLKRSAEYDIDYVEHLRDGVEKYASFACISNVDVPCERIPSKHDWPGWWSKMELFSPDIKGDFLYLDLDTLIVGDIGDLFVGCFTMLSDFYHPSRLASGMMFLPEKDRSAVWEEWIKAPEEIMPKYRGWGDGGFIAEVMPNAARWQDIRPGQVVSYKAHVRKSTRASETGAGAVPKDARVCCFHGQPRPRALNWAI